jgi:hypothetical protein
MSELQAKLARRRSLNGEIEVTAENFPKRAPEIELGHPASTPADTAAPAGTAGADAAKQSGSTTFSASAQASVGMKSPTRADASMDLFRDKTHDPIAAAAAAAGANFGGPTLVTLPIGHQSCISFLDSHGLLRLVTTTPACIHTCTIGKLLAINNIAVHQPTEETETETGTKPETGAEASREQRQTSRPSAREMTAANAVEANCSHSASASASASAFGDASRQLYALLKTSDVQTVTLQTVDSSTASAPHIRSDGSAAAADCRVTCSSSASASEHEFESESESGLGCELVFVQVPDAQSLGIVVSPVLASSSSSSRAACGGLRVIEITTAAVSAPAAQLDNTSDAAPVIAAMAPPPPPSPSSFRLNDVIVSVNGRDLCVEPSSGALTALRGSLGRRITVERQAIKGSLEQNCAAKEGEQCHKSASARKVAAGDVCAEPAIGVDENLPESSCGEEEKQEKEKEKEKKVEVEDEDEGEEEGEYDCIPPAVSAGDSYHALKRRVVARYASRPLYAAGNRVPVDRTRQRPPTMLAEIYPTRPGASVLPLSDDPFVSTMRRMRRRLQASSDAVQAAEDGY